jgi:DNA-binding response OmpR family regulator
MFLDDEFFSEETNPAIEAANELENIGYEVKRTDKMSEVIDTFYKSYYDLYILDIDMGKVEDENMKDENGASVGKILRQLSTISKIIVFSARGDVNDWFISANYHFDGYVYKKEDEASQSGIKALIEMVNGKIGIEKKLEFSLKEKTRDKLVYYTVSDNDYIKDNEVNSLISNFGHKTRKFEYIEDIIDELDKKTEKPESIVIVKNELHYDEDYLEVFKKLFSFQPEPQVIFAFKVNSQDRDLVIRLINENPFKLLNIKNNIKVELENSIKDANIWYGRDEIFELPTDKEIVRFPLSDKEIDEITKDDRDFYYENEEEDE